MSRYLLPLAFAIALTGPLLTASRPAAQQQPPDRPMFQSRIEAIRIDALVTENDQPVRGLEAADFEVLDNGVRQQVDSLSFDNTPLDLVLALDTSGSVTGTRLAQLRDAAGGVLEHLREDDRAGLVTFNRIVLLSSTLTLDRVTIRDALGAAIPSGETSLRDGVFSGLTVADVGAGRALLVVFSDGIDTASWLSAHAVLDIARRADVVVYGISTNKAPFLEEIAAVTGGAVFQGEWPTLSQTFLGVLDEFRRRYVLTYSPRGVEAGGWHRLTVRVKGRSVRVKARAGYMGTPSRP